MQDKHLEKIARSLDLSIERLKAEAEQLGRIFNSSHQAFLLKKETQESIREEVEWALAFIEDTKYQKCYKPFLMKRSLAEIKHFVNIMCLSPKEKHVLELYNFFLHHAKKLKDLQKLENFFLSYPKMRFLFKKYRNPSLDDWHFQKTVSHVLNVLKT